MKKFFIGFAVLTAILIVILALKLVQQGEQARRPPGSMGVVEGVRVTVASRIPSRIVSMHKAEGDTVRTGEVLAELDCTEANAAVAEARARLEAAEAAVAVSLRQTEATTLQASAASRSAAGILAQEGAVRAQADHAHRQADRAKRLLTEGAVSDTTFEQAETASKDLSHRIRAAGQASESARLSAQAARSQAAMATEGIRAAERQRDAVQAALARLQVAQSECRIAAPRDGTVTVRAREEGEVVLPGTTLYEILDDSQATITFYVGNDDLAQVQVGMPVKAIADAFPDMTFDGRVTRIGREAEFTPRTIQTRTDRSRLVYAVEAVLHNQDGRLRSGMPAEVRISGGP